MGCSFPLLSALGDQENDMDGVNVLFRLAGMFVFSLIFLRSVWAPLSFFAAPSQSESSIAFGTAQEYRYGRTSTQVFWSNESISHSEHCSTADLSQVELLTSQHREFP